MVRVVELTDTDRSVLLRAAELLAPQADPYFEDPVAWAKHNIDYQDDELAYYQGEALEAVPVYKRVSVRGPHGLGKTTTAAHLILWFADTRDRCPYHTQCDWKIVTTASNWRQLSQYLWPEVHKWARRMKYRQWKLGTELLTLHIKLNRGEAFAAASDDPRLIEGAHAVHILYVFDEAKAIIADTFDAAEGAFSTAGGDTGSEAFAFCMSTPGSPNGRFHDIQTRRPGYEDWHVIAVTKEAAISAGRISQEWVDQRRKQWGERSAVFQNRVEGKFAVQEEDGIVPLDWIEASMERWKDQVAVYLEHPDRMPDFTALGVDVARSGIDKTVLAPRFGPWIAELEVIQGQDTMQTVGEASRILSVKGGHAVVDVIGIGAGVVDRLRELGHQVDAFNGASATDLTDLSGELGFINRRAAAYWMMREVLDPKNNYNFCLPPDDELIGDLTAPKWKLTSGGRIQVESKADIVKRIGRSPDRGDAVVYSMALDPEVAPEAVYYSDPVTISPF